MVIFGEHFLFRKKFQLYCVMYTCLFFQVHYCQLFYEKYTCLLTKHYYEKEKIEFVFFF